MSVNETLNRIENEVDTQESLIGQIQTALAGKMDGSAPRLQNKTVNINLNGTTIVVPSAGYDGLSKVTINADIPNDVDKLIEKSITTIRSNVASVNQYAIYKISSLTTLELPNADNIQQYGAYGNTGLRGDLTLPNVTYISSYGVGGNSNLTRLILPKLESTSTIPFANVGYLSVLDIGSPNVNTTFSSRTLDQLNNTRTLKIALRSSSVIPYNNTSSGYDPSNVLILVPRALVDSYKVATNWSRLADKIVALEDYTSDGTTTGTVIV